MMHLHLSVGNFLDVILHCIISEASWPFCLHLLSGLWQYSNVCNRLFPHRAGHVYSSNIVTGSTKQQCTYCYGWINNWRTCLIQLHVVIILFPLSNQNTYWNIHANADFWLVFIQCSLQSHNQILVLTNSIRCKFTTSSWQYNNHCNFIARCWLV